MQKLVERHDAPSGAIVPKPIEREGLFNLDVDDDIWQDVDLDDPQETSNGTLIPPVPRWLGDENVRSGIAAMLKLDRCHEEERRLEDELETIWEWGRIEWQAIEVAKLWEGTSQPTLCVSFIRFTISC